MAHNEGAFTPEAERPAQTTCRRGSPQPRVLAPGEREMTDPVTNSIDSALKECPSVRKLLGF
jgi:hypothetical protein